MAQFKQTCVTSKDEWNPIIFHCVAVFNLNLTRMILKKIFYILFTHTYIRKSNAVSIVWIKCKLDAVQSLNGLLLINCFLPRKLLLIFELFLQKPKKSCYCLCSCWKNFWTYTLHFFTVISHVTYLTLESCIKSHVLHQVNFLFALCFQPSNSGPTLVDYFRFRSNVHNRELGLLR